jgi:hypothetical protein
MWLNSDDMLMPNSLSFLAQIADTEKQNIYAGNCIHFKMEADQRLTSWGSDIINTFNSAKLEETDCIIQPSSFWTRKAREKAGHLNEDMHYTFDWEWFMRAKTNGVQIIPVEKCLSLYRYHSAHKSSAGGTSRQQEVLDFYKLYNPKWALLYGQLINENLDAISKYQGRLKGLPFRLSLTVSDGYILKKLKPGKYKDFTSQEITRAISML